SRSIWIGSHRTSVRLEPVMWAALNDIAVERGKTVHDVVLEITRGRKGINLTAAIRVYIVEYYREALGRCRKEKAPPSSGAGDLKESPLTFINHTAREGVKGSAKRVKLTFTRSGTEDADGPPRHRSNIEKIY